MNKKTLFIISIIFILLTYFQILGFKRNIMEISSLKLETESGKYLSYKYIKSNSSKNYLILYIHGYSDNMKESKSMKMEQIAKNNNIDLVKFDLYGHGESSGELNYSTMDDWYNSCKIIIEKIINPTNKKIILIGSSLGGWLSYILAEELKDKIIAIVSVAGAIDFFTETIEPLIKKEGKDKEFVYEMVYDSGKPSGDLISRKLIESSRKYNLLNKDKINIKCIIRIIHGLKDQVVPYQSSIKFANKVESQDVKLFLEKNMNHDLTLNNNLDTLDKIVSDLIKDLEYI